MLDAWDAVIEWPRSSRHDARNDARYDAIATSTTVNEWSRRSLKHGNVTVKYVVND